ncbi:MULTISPECIES: hypothetical protein [unclassified Neorhizobium]|uniref:hypothetical protein n=1 Tax=unclassified Neorhizobium TaxID=2629175 RepID=UPI001FF1E3AC|nr:MULTISPECIES: hypothetical protein [unclassified Neorhizobium]MCJ9669024.1 hypothetical protein [Neorhizobium sp. SHOUNA12B]MCJ9744978.1 hypothetical protein [Neorhizobium sp. SHOUNA12A]
MFKFMLHDAPNLEIGSPQIADERKYPVQPRYSNGVRLNMFIKLIFPDREFLVDTFAKFE